jgi:hypothetical protein
VNIGTQKSEKITKQLIEFGKQLKLKNNGSVEIDSATWYLEGLMNYENANNNHNHNNLDFYHDSIVVYTSGESITLNELNNAYIYFTNKLTQILVDKNDTSYKCDLIDIQIKPTGLKNGETTIKIMTSMGSLPIGFNYTFGPNDYWKWGWKLGRCDIYNGLNIGKDATDQLELRMNAVAYTQPGYFTEVVELTIYPGSEYFDPNYPGTWVPYMMFFASGSGINPPEEPCLSPLELNYYLDKFAFIKIYNQPPTKIFKSVNVYYDYTVGTNSWTRVHAYSINYGKYVETQIPS